MVTENDLSNGSEIGKESIASIEGIGETPSYCSRQSCKTSSNSHIEVFAIQWRKAVKGPGKERCSLQI